MQIRQLNKISILILFLIVSSSCHSPYSEKSKKFELTIEEHLLLEKFFRYFMLYETGIYTLIGSKPLTQISLFYENMSEEDQREKQRDLPVYFLLNQDNKKDREFYKTLSAREKKEKACLIRGKDFIYDIEDIWKQWELIQARFSLKKRFLLVKKERPIDTWKELFPECEAVYDIFFVDVLKTALIIQENYPSFRKLMGHDFDPLQIVFELENNNSDFWDCLRGKDSWQHASLWGLLYGFGKENSFSYTWKWRHLKEPNLSEEEKLLSSSIKQWSSCKKRPSRSAKGAFSISNFTIPIFASFIENDPIITQYEAERERIKRLYRGKDFVTLTLELLTESSTENSLPK